MQSATRFIIEAMSVSPPVVTASFPFPYNYTFTYHHIENDYSVKLTRKCIVCHHEIDTYSYSSAYIVENIYIFYEILSSMYFP